MKTEILIYNNFNLHIAKPDFFTTKLRLQNNNWLFNNFDDVFHSINLHGPGTILDVGANYGVASLEFFTKNIGDHFIMFEPILDNCQCIEKTFTNTNINYTLHNIGISNRSGTEHFLFKKTMSGTSGITDKNNANMEIKIDKIDNYTFDKIKLIKIDTEGYELEVLEGSVNTIIKHQPVLFFECDPKNTDQINKITQILSLLNKLNYKVINSSYHVIENYSDIQVANLVSNTFVNPVRDLIAIPKKTFNMLITYKINANELKDKMFDKLGKKYAIINNIPFVECKQTDKVVEFYTNNDIVYLNENIFKTNKKGQKMFVKYNNKFYWSYELFLHYPVNLHNNLFEF